MRNTWVVLMLLALGTCAAAADGGTQGSALPDGGSPRGGLDKERIRLGISAHRDEIRACYERALARKPGLKGLVKVRFVINADGSVSEPSTPQNTVGDAGLAQCITDRLTTWRFPPVEGGGRIVVIYPFTFKVAPVPDAGT